MPFERTQYNKQQRHNTKEKVRDLGHQIVQLQKQVDELQMLLSCLTDDQLKEAMVVYNSKL